MSSRSEHIHTCMYGFIKFETVVSHGSLIHRIEINKDKNRVSFPPRSVASSVILWVKDSIIINIIMIFSALLFCAYRFSYRLK